MRCAFVSDLHANLQAWKAVLLDIRSLDVDKIVCLGDIVGYGPNPAEVLESVHGAVDHFVLGNHDAVVCGKMDPALFNDSAQRIIEWTQARLSGEASTFLSSLPLSLRATSFRCAHATLASPATFDYIVDPHDALPSWRAVEEPLLFVGHTHVPGIYVIGHSGTPHRIDPQDFALEAEKRYLVNVGSTGQPRDGETRACYCILDTESGTIVWRRIPFDLDAYRAALQGTAIDERTSYFLSADPLEGLPPLRDLLQFSPAVQTSDALQRTREVAEVDVLRKRVHRWKVLYTVTLLAGMMIATAITALWWRHHFRALMLLGTNTIGTAAQTARADDELLGRIDAPSPQGASLQSWSILLGNRRHQAVHVVDSDDGPTLVLESGTRADPLTVRSWPVRVTPGMKLCMQALFRPSDDFSGTIAEALVLTRRRGAEDELDPNFRIKAPNQPRAGGWVLASSTFETPADAASVTVEIRGRFRGQVEVKDVSLVKKP